MRESWPSRRAAASSGAARRASLAPEMVRRASSAPGMGVDPLAGLVAGLAARRCASECVAGLWSAVADAASKSIDAAVLPSGVGIFSSASGRVIDHNEDCYSESKISTKLSCPETAVVERRRGVREALRTRETVKKATNCSAIEHQKADSPANFSALAPFLAEPLRYDT